MVEIFAVSGLALVSILLLCLWADVRELKRELKTWRRDFMRNSVGGRTSDGYPGFSEEAYWREAREAQEQESEEEAKAHPEMERVPGDCQPEPVRQRKVVTLKPGEEQVLREILVEFLS